MRATFTEPATIRCSTGPAALAVHGTRSWAGIAESVQAPAGGSEGALRSSSTTRLDAHRLRKPQARHGLWHGSAAERPLNQVRRPAQAVGGLDARPQTAGPRAVGRVSQDDADRVAESVHRQPPDRDRPAGTRPLDPGPD